MNQSLHEIKDTQNTFENQFSKALDDGDSAKLSTATKNLKAATHTIERSMKQNPLGDDIFAKIELDRLFLENILSNLIPEISASNYETLKSSVLIEKNNKIEFQNIIRREEESRKNIKDLQKSLIDIKVDKEVEIQKRNELIAHLKDRLQELKAKTNMEAKYVKKSTDNSVSQTKKKCDISEQELKQQIEVTKKTLNLYFVCFV